MNCRASNDQLVPYLEGLLDDSATLAVEEHLADCPMCRADEQATRRLRERLLEVGDVAPSASLGQTVMDQILIQQVETIRRLTMRRRIRLFGISGIAAAVLLSFTWAALRYGPTTAVATENELIARGVQAATNLQSIYMKCRMRTLPRDNFEYLDPKHEFVDVELWKQFGPTLKWRIEKPGRVAAMNGRETVMLIDNRVGVKFETPARSAFDTEWLHRLAAIDGMLSTELAAVSLPGVKTDSTRTEGPSDSEHQTVIIKVRTKDEVDSYLKNRFLSMSDTRREYTFDRQSGRLENAEFYSQSDGQDVLVLEIVKIDYDPVIDDSRFELEIPENVVWYREPQRLPDNEKYEKMTPLETARAFFEACSKRDWDEAGKFWLMPFTDEIKQYLGGLEIVSLGEPFQAKPYAGWFVPYEIRLVGGYVKKHNLALRNDNPAKRFVVDGGL